MEAHTITFMSHRFEIAVEETRGLLVVRVTGCCVASKRRETEAAI